MRKNMLVLFFIAIFPAVFLNCKKDVTEPTEPKVDIKETTTISLPQNTNIVFGVQWENSGNGFYFYGGDGSLSTQLYYCSRSDYSIKKLPLKMDGLNLFDITKDDKTLLLADNIGTSGNIYVYDIQSDTKTVLIPAQDKLIITSAKFSNSDNKIAFSTEKLESNVSSGYAVFLFTRSDNSLKILDAVSKYSTIIGWAPNSDDKLYYHYQLGQLSEYSISGDSSNSVTFSNDAFLFNILPDGNTVLAIHAAVMKNSEVFESHVAMFNTSGQYIRELTSLSTNLYTYAASPDQKVVIYTGYLDQKWGMWVSPM